MLTIIDMAIGNNLRRLREARGLTCQELAAHVRLNAADIYRFEQGDTRIQACTLYDLSRCLDASISEFFSSPGFEDGGLGAPGSTAAKQSAHSLN